MRVRRTLETRKYPGRDTQGEIPRARIRVRTRVMIRVSIKVRIKVRIRVRIRMGYRGMEPGANVGSRGRGGAGAA